MNPNKIKDTRASAARSGRKFNALISKAMSGDLTSEDTAESFGLRCLGLLCAEYIMSDEPLGQAMRAFMEKIMNRADPLRKDIPLEVWSAIWPTLNTITHARSKYVGAIQEIGTHQSNGVGVLGNDSGVTNAVSETSNASEGTV